MALTEIARSFSFKLNVGNYESRDFFCSRKMEVPEEQAEAASEELHQFCMDQVRRDVAAYKKRQQERNAAPAAAPRSSSSRPGDLY